MLLLQGCSLFNPKQPPSDQTWLDRQCEDGECVVAGRLFELSGEWNDLSGKTVQLVNREAEARDEAIVAETDTGIYGFYIFREVPRDLIESDKALIGIPRLNTRQAAQAASASGSVEASAPCYTNPLLGDDFCYRELEPDLSCSLEPIDLEEPELCIQSQSDGEGNPPDHITIFSPPRRDDSDPHAADHGPLRAITDSRIFRTGQSYVTAFTTGPEQHELTLRGEFRTDEVERVVLSATSLPSEAEEGSTSRYTASVDPETGKFELANVSVGKYRLMPSPSWTEGALILQTESGKVALTDPSSGVAGANGGPIIEIPCGPGPTFPIPPDSAGSTFPEPCF